MKRPYPFGDTVVLQTKIHVGNKEVNLGVKEEENMRTVHAHTIQKLFEGRRRFYGNPGVHMPVMPVSLAPQLCYSISGTAALRQMSITSQGNISSSSPEETAALQTGAVGCPSCARCHTASVCSYCDRAVCESCIRCCHLCSMAFCPDHALTCYGISGDAAVCLSCHR